MASSQRHAECGLSGTQSIDGPRTSLLMSDADSGALGAAALDSALKMVEDDLPVQSKVSRIWGETRGQATNRDCALVLAHSDGNPVLERTDVDWDEPWKDGGPDAAHERLRIVRPSREQSM